MSDQIQRLREVAEAATEGPWAIDGPWWHSDDAAGHDMTEMVTTNSIDRIPVAVTVNRAERRDGRDRNLDMRHIATFDPPTVLELLDRLERAEAAVGRLERWKAEAISLFDGMQDLGRALGLPLGTLITGPVAVEAAQELRAKVERVWRLHQPSYDGCSCRLTSGPCPTARALDGGE